MENPTVKHQHIHHNRDGTGHISKWEVKLGALKLRFRSRRAIKLQALVDFLAKSRENQIPAPANIPEHWIMYFDGSLKPGRGGAVDAKINTLESEGKYSTSFGKSTKRASQLDL